MIESSALSCTVIIFSYTDPFAGGSFSWITKPVANFGTTMVSIDWASIVLIWAVIIPGTLQQPSMLILGTKINSMKCTHYVPKCTNIYIFDILALTKIRQTSSSEARAVLMLTSFFTGSRGARAGNPPLRLKWWKLLSSSSASRCYIRLIDS